MPLQLHGWQERVQLLSGTALVLVTGPVVGAVVGSTVLWEAIDRGFKGGLVESNHELSGLLMGQIVPWFDRLTKPINKRFVKHEDDAFVVNASIYFGFGLPALLYAFAQLTLAAESTAACIGIWFAYHVLRIGPYFMNFAYVYTLCHKEGHAAAARNGLFAAPFDKYGPLRYLFNWWVGLYYGVMPASFAVGHSINHHKYNNGPADVVSTSDKPRDEWLALVCYVPRFLLYACNVSTTLQFIKEGKYKVAFDTVLGTLYFFGFVGLVAWKMGLTFAAAYLIYPFLEQTLMLSGINWSWHAFIDPDDVENEYVQSITILGGTINVLNEDSHVVHHQYPGSHWSKHPRLLTKHIDKYKESRGSVFYGTHTFEMLALILMRDYDKLADRFLGHLPSNAEAELFGCGTHDKSSVTTPKLVDGLSKADAAELIKKRLQACWWGPRATHKNAALLSSHAGESFARAKEWEEAPGCEDSINAEALSAPATEDAMGVRLMAVGSKATPARAGRSPHRRRKAD